MSKFVSALVLVLSSSSAVVAQDAGNTVMAQDTLTVKVLEWLPAQGEYKEWTAAGGQYAVGQDGNVVVPFVGAVSTTGLTPAEIAQDISARMEERMALATQLDVNVEFAARQPIFMLGGVETPGEVTFRPNMTVMQAVALAGGFYRTEAGFLRLERDAISAEGAMAQALDNATRAKARLGRLEAELAREETVRSSDLAPEVEVPTAMIAEEQEILDVRRRARESRLESINSLKTLATEQLVNLNAQTANLDRQIQLTRTELDGIASLVERGLSTTSRAFALERTLAEVEGRRIDVNGAVLQANLQLNEADRDAVDIETELQSTVALEIQAARSTLNESLVAIKTSRELLREAATTAPARLIDEGGAAKVNVRFLLTRHIGDQSIVREVDGATRLLPGDTLDVELASSSDRNPASEESAVSEEPTLRSSALRDGSTSPVPISRKADD